MQTSDIERDPSILEIRAGNSNVFSTLDVDLMAVARYPVEASSFHFTDGGKTIHLNQIVQLVTAKRDTF